MNFSQLQTQVSNFLGRSTAHPGSWTDQEIKDALNEAQLDAEIIIDNVYEYFFIAYFQLPEVSGQKTYHLPDDCKRVLRVGRAGERAMRRIMHAHEDEDYYATLTGLQNLYGYTDESYQQEGDDKINLMKASTADPSHALIVVYIRRLLEMAEDEDVSAIPREHHPYLKWRAIKILLPKEEEGGARMNEVNRILAEKEMALRQHVKMKNIQSPRYMHYIDDGGW